MKHKVSKEKKLIIVCDESVKKGKSYSYFYGGAMVEESDYENLTMFLNIAKSHLGLHEMKRIKITEKNYKDYITILSLFFDFVRSGKIKVRVMFSPNNQLAIIPKEKDESYSKFYYTFIKNAFSLYYTNFNIRLRLIFDELPDKAEINNKFKAYLITNLKHANKLNNKIFTKWNLIEEVDSKKHPILQCIDVITGVIENELNLEKSEDLSKRKIAKRKVFNFIMQQVLTIHENFVLTETTSPIYSIKGFYDKYKHFVYKKKTPSAST